MAPFSTSTWTHASHGLSLVSLLLYFFNQQLHFSYTRETAFSGSGLTAERDMEGDGQGSSGPNLSFIKANSAHWKAGKDELREGTLLIWTKRKIRDDLVKPDDRTTCLECERMVNSSDAFHLAALSNDPWKRRYPRHFMLHPGCLPKWCVPSKQTAKDCESREESRSQPSEQAA